ncbi:MAG: helix-turn-helix domain-containing protein [Ilumatobacteraceae bacterium]
MASDTVEPGFPRVLAIAWGMDEAPQRGPERELTHESIVDAAILLADQGGLAGVTMQRVAEALGFSAMALYRYVASKDELIMLMQDRAMNFDGVWPVESDDWRTGLADLARTLQGCYGRHSWMLDVAMSATTAVMPNSVRYTDAALRAMRRLPVPASERNVVVLAVSLLVRSYCLLERDLATAGGTDGPASADFTPGILALLREVVTPERFPDLAREAATFFGDDSGVDDFQFVFGRFLDGLDAYVRSRPLPPPTPLAAPTPSEALARAEHDLATLVAQRKEAEQRVKELQRRIGRAERERDRAKQRLK